MYHEIEDKAFLKKMRDFANDLMRSVCSYLQEEGIEARYYLVGSGARDMILQNANEPVDLDYNLEIRHCSKMDARVLREQARKALNKALKDRALQDCDDSRSVLNTKKMCFLGDRPRDNLWDGCLQPGVVCFYIDLCITRRDRQGNIQRLIHKKTGNTHTDEYIWNDAQSAGNLSEKVQLIQQQKKWKELKARYLDRKNMYLCRNNHDHPSYVCYLEVVNEMYHSLTQE